MVIRLRKPFFDRFILLCVPFFLSHCLGCTTLPVHQDIPACEIVNQRTAHHHLCHVSRLVNIILVMELVEIKTEIQTETLIHSQIRRETVPFQNFKIWGRRQYQSWYTHFLCNKGPTQDAEEQISVLQQVLFSEIMKTTSPAEKNMLQHTHLGFILELTSRVPQGLYGEYISQASCLSQQKQCAKTDTVFFPISEVSEGTVSPNRPGLAGAVLQTPV